MVLNLAKLFCLALCLLPCTLCGATVFNTDICIYGGTSAGVTAAVQAHDFEQDAEHAAIAMEYVLYRLENPPKWAGGNGG